MNAGARSSVAPMNHPKVDESAVQRPAPAAAEAEAPPPLHGQPFFHEASGCVRFWVEAAGGALVAASVSREALHYRYRPNERGDDAMVTFGQYAADIHAVVRRRLAEGAREPVMLREYDLRRGA